jgi:para-nitrobenzyl esterase
MKKLSTCTFWKLWMLVAILTCSAAVVLTGCKGGKQPADEANDEAAKNRELIRARYGENKTITDGSYDPSLAAKCVNGTFVGKLTDSTIVYRGIPYVGRQPVGELRWKEPVDVVPCDSVYEAYYNAKSAMQPLEEISGDYYQGENCLYLNVWRSAKKSAEKKSVLVWIHGGGYAYGGTVDPLYDFHDFVEENPDVIIVSAAYRLGVLGYLHLSHLPDGKDYPTAQNLGLKDQLQALKWVHENIAAFGGDPDNVTIWGESAGAGSCTMQPLVPGSQQYFKRLIAQSGSVNLSRTPEEGIACTNRLMEELGCKTVADLLKVSGEKLLEASAINFVHQMPERDGRILPLEPFKAYADGAAKDIEILVGCNKDEMNFFVSSFGKEGWDKWIAGRKQGKFAQLAPEDKALAESFMKDVKGDYFQPDSSLFSQSWFNTAIIKLSECQTKAGGKAYTYYFTPESADPIMKCGHAIELPIVFNHPEFTSELGREFNPTFCKTMRKLWVQFAKTGNPSLSAAESPDEKVKDWPLYDLKDKKVMVLDEFDIHVAKEADVKIVDWERTYPLTKYYAL